MGLDQNLYIRPNILLKENELRIEVIDELENVELSKEHIITTLEKLYDMDSTSYKESFILFVEELAELVGQHTSVRDKKEIEKPSNKRRVILCW